MLKPNLTSVKLKKTLHTRTRQATIKAGRPLESVDFKAGWKQSPRRGVIVSAHETE
jgi:hypothetical protein